MKNIYRIVFLLHFSLAAAALGAQTYDWAKMVEGNDAQSISGILLGNDNHIYLSGFFESTCDFDPGAGVTTRMSTGDTDAWFGKYDTLGNVIWLNTLYGSGAIYNDVNNGVMMIEVDNNSNVYACGAYYLGLDLDPGPGTHTLPFDGISDIFLAKYNVGGGLIWGFGIGGGDWDSPTSMRLDKDQNIMICGAFRDTMDFDPGPGVTEAISVGEYDMFLVKYSPLGNLMWVKTWGSPYNDLVSSFTFGPDNSIHITGGYCAPIDLDPGPGTDMHGFAGEVDLFYLVLDQSGNFVRAMDIGGTGAESGGGIELGNDGKVYICGTYEDTLDFDPGAGVLSRAATGYLPDLFFVCYDSTNVPVWANTFGNTGVEQVSGMRVDANGDLISSGRFPYTVDFDPGPGVHDLTAVGLPDMWFAKYRGDDGSLVWAGSIGSTGNEHSHGFTLDNKGRIYLIGAYEETVDFDPLAGTAFFSSVDEDDGFFARYLDETLTAVKPASAPGEISVYPNPAKESVILYSPEPILKTEMVNMQGQVVWSAGTQLGSALQIDCSGLAQGVYVVNVQMASGHQNIRLMKE